MPLLSIIIPIYNSSKFLNRCLDSIINQKFEDWELILVNDGSTDNSLEICNQYAKKDYRIKIIDKKNEGAGPTRTAGIAVATGKYIAFPDSDDRMDISAYKDCIRVLEDNHCDILVFGMKTEIYDDDNGIVKDTVEDHVPDLLIKSKDEFRKNFKFLYQNMDMGSPCNKIYRKSIIDKHELKFPDLRRMQDCVFNLNYFDKIDSFCSINKNFFIRTWHTSEVQRKKMPKNFIDCAITHYSTQIDMLKKWGVYNEEHLVYFGDKFSEVIMAAEFSYLPSQRPSFFELYPHIKSINRNKFIHNFYKKMKKVKKLRKKETAMLYNLNLLLAVELYLNLKK